MKTILYNFRRKKKREGGKEESRITKEYQREGADENEVEEQFAVTTNVGHWNEKKLARNSGNFCTYILLVDNYNPISFVSPSIPFSPVRFHRALIYSNDCAPTPTT